MNYTIDATGKKLGRISSEAAAYLRGKMDTDFAPNKVSDVKVTITNASQLDLSEQRLSEEYTTYSGYPGGLKHETRGHLLGRRGIKEVVMRTVRGMLPRTKLRTEMLKNLTITE
jgi:large subunit ribosomal protein L13